MDFTKIARNKNEIPSRKTSAIPRLHNKQNIVETIIPGRYEEENFKHSNNLSKKNKEDRESCFCNNCYNKTKNLCRFTLNENLIRNLESKKEEKEEEEEGELGYNESEDDDVNSTAIITDGDSHSSEDNYANKIENQNNNRYGETILTIEKTASNEPDQLRSSNYDKSQTTEFLQDTPTTILFKEPKEITKDLQNISIDFDHTEVKMREDDELSKCHTIPERNCTTSRKSKTDSAEHINSCLLKVSTRDRLKYTLTNVTKIRPKKQKTSLSKESSTSSSRCVTPTEISLQKRRKKFGDLNVTELLNESNSKNCVNCSVQKQTSLFNEDSNWDNYLCEHENYPLSHLLRTGNPWDNIGCSAKVNKPKNSECVNQSNFDDLLNTPKENKCDFLMNALLEVFGNDSHITQKIRNSSISKYDTRFRNIRSAESYNINVDSDGENMTKIRTCCSRKSIESKKDRPKPVTCRNDDTSIHTLSSLEKSLPEETFSSALCSTDTDYSKTSGTKYSKRETCISFKRCRCQSLKCYQLDELNESITSMQTEIKTLIKNMPCGKNCNCTISDEIAKLKLFYQECQQNEQKRKLQQKKLECDIKEIYLKIDKLIETSRGPSFLKCFILFPLIGILTVYTVSCLGELRKN